MLSQARKFFDSRAILEVDCGALLKRAPIDSNIDVMSVSISSTEQGFLHTSPEYAMKRLLSLGSGDIFFLGHVFRKEEKGRLHSPEFTMAEWYRVGISFEEMIQETCDFLSLFLGVLPIRILSYREAFNEYGTGYTNPLWSETEIRHYVLSHQVEPRLGRGEMTVLIDYPPNEAALACTIKKEGECVAERFEIYYEGVELANGYHELSDAQELEKRFNAENRARASRGGEMYLLDEDFLASLKSLPDCCGVSVGFDRALMLQQKKSSLKEALFY